jgi:hypothetical protein
VFALSGEENTVGFRGFEKPTADYQLLVCSTSHQSKPAQQSPVASTSRQRTPPYQSPVHSTSRQSKPSTSRQSGGLVYKSEEYYACDLMKTRLSLCEKLLSTSKQGETSAGETLKYAVKTFHVAT